jgi:hypothetical protein
VKDTETRRAKARARASAWGLLAHFAGYEGPALHVRTRDDAHEATVTVGPLGGASSGERKCLQFSPVEAAVVNALGPDGCLTGKVIARRVSQPYGTTLKIHLRNLVERQALTHTAEGYRWHPRFRGDVPAEQG